VTGAESERAEPQRGEHNQLDCIDRQRWLNELIAPGRDAIERIRNGLDGPEQQMTDEDNSERCNQCRRRHARHLAIPRWVTEPVLLRRSSCDGGKGAPSPMSRSRCSACQKAARTLCIGAAGARV
jgi:hypothetical protein